MFTFNKFRSVVFGVIGSLATHPGLYAAVEDDASPEVFQATADYTIPSIFNWNLNGNTSTQTVSPAAAVFDQVTSDSNSNKLDRNNATFNVIFGDGVNLSDTFWDSDQSWLVFSGFNTGGGNNNTSFSLGSVPSDLASQRPGASFSVSPVSPAGGSTLSYTAASFVPEPSSAMAGFVLSLGLVWRRRSS